MMSAAISLLLSMYRTAWIALAVGFLFWTFVVLLPRPETNLMAYNPFREAR